MVSENFKSSLPSELDALERAVKGEGVVQRFPPAGSNPVSAETRKEKTR